MTALGPPSCGGSVASFKRRCGNPATTTLLVGCIHEHVAEKPVCDEHLKLTLDGRTACRECRAHDGHLCVLHVGGQAATEAHGETTEAQGARE